ncbi:DoxX family protein [Thermomicrobiaceae bacterium CFH 74404]|uniref:DoxX family protein n=1 Tax=Thermalbibacter longus TaxID=2951981 RepID=A0AA42BBM7_9BACT|nr:DoxX family protein [Thermalbibacter longus]MCM8747963.1 DoxX family protein [Thermalbibacter longus]
MVDLAILVLRLTLGALLTGHGFQKLSRRFGGGGLVGTAAWLESIGLRPGKRWAPLAASAEFGGGLLTLLGFLNPLGPLAIVSTMTMATATVHWGKPIWVTAGGAELPLTNMAIASALALAGPGRYSLDHALGIRLPRWLFPLGMAVIVTVAALARAGVPPIVSPPAPSEPERPGEQASAGTQG